MEVSIKRQRRQVFFILLLTVWWGGIGCSAKNLRLDSKRKFSDVLDPGSVMYRAGMQSNSISQSWDQYVVEFTGNCEEYALRKADYSSATTEASRTVARDRIVRLQLANIEQYHEAYSAALHWRVAAGKTGFDFGILGLTLASTISGGAATKTVLSAIATTVVGAELAVEENFLNKQGSLAMLAQMVSLRNERRVEIEQKLRTLNDDQYPLAQVEPDLLRYFASSSLIAAIISLNEEATNRQRQSEEARAAEVGVASMVGDLRERIAAWMNADDTARKNSLANWISVGRENGFLGDDENVDDQEFDVTFWLYAESTNETHLKAAITQFNIP